MAFVSLYRKYRSQSFADLIGQDHVVRTLQNALESGRTSHAFLFTGPRGTGKTSTARLLAKALCCESGPRAEPCGECELCVSIAAGTCLDVLEIDAASESGVEEVRDTIVSTSEYQPVQARFRIFIIDEVHDLSAKAFDALLKTIEEPPPHVVFILATTEYAKVPPTIRSRCQKFEFHRAKLSDLVGRLEYVTAAEEIQIEPAAIAAIARMADGGYRDALTLLEQATLMQGAHVTLQGVYDQLGLISEEQIDALIRAVASADPKQVLVVTAELIRMGRDPKAILDSLLHRIADLTSTLYGLDAGLEAAAAASAHALAIELGTERLLRLRGELAEALRAIPHITLPRIWLDSVLIRCSLPLEAAPAAAAVPKPTPKPAAQAPAQGEAKPKPEPMVQPKPAPRAAPAADPKPESGPQPKPAAGPWATLCEALMLKSKALYARVHESSATLEGDTLTIYMPRKMDFEWVSGDPKKLEMLTMLASEAYGKPVKIQTEHRAETREDKVVTVELELQGEDLYKALSEIKGNGTE